jgi:hypothetical protein
VIYLITFLVVCGAFIVTSFLKNPDLFFSDKTFVGLQPDFFVNVQAETMGLLLETAIIATFLPWILARRQRKVQEHTKRFVALQLRDLLSGMLLGIDGIPTDQYMHQIDGLMRQSLLSLDTDARAVSLRLVNALDTYALTPDSRYSAVRLKNAYDALLETFGISGIERKVWTDRLSIAIQYKKA